MDLGLTGKVALITGGSEGIGLATAVNLAREGASVAIAARTPEKLARAAALIKEQGGEAVLTIVADISQEADCARAVAEAVAQFGRLDILVNNAGSAAGSPFEQISDESWHGDMDLKLLGAIRCSRAALPHLKAADGAAIINVVAIGGKAPGAASMPSSVSRASGLALTKAMSRDLGPSGIRVNAVCIGVIRSAQIERGWKRSMPDRSWEEFSRERGKTVPLGRLGETDEAGRVITFLASPAASYVTGVSVNIDGGASPVM
jgi:3-oxoacyl-[acyl-carrier protein] reductase